MVSLVVLGHFSEGLYHDIKNQTFQDFEIIVAREKGIVNAMNIALDKAKGEIFVRIDDDVRLPDRWLEELVKCFDDPFVVGATGPTYIPPELYEKRDSINFVKNHFTNPLFRWLMDGKPEAPARIFSCGAVSYGSNFEPFVDDEEEYRIDHLEGTNWAVRTWQLKYVGGFDPAFNGVAEWYDDDALYKIIWMNQPLFKLKYNPKAYLWHMVEQGSPHYAERFEWVSRIKNWLRFHWRHSKFHYKKVIWFLLMIGYYLTRRK